MQRLDGTTTLPTGLRLRLRMPQRFDQLRLRALFERIGLVPDELQISRALRFVPRDRVAVVATTLVGRTEEIVGLAVTDRFAESPDLVLADEAQAPGVGAFLEDALRAHGQRARRIA
jgi:hypothetical protein